MLLTYLIAIVKIYLHNLHTNRTQKIKLYSIWTAKISVARATTVMTREQKIATTGGHNDENFGNVLDSDGKIYIYMTCTQTEYKK